MTPAERTTLYGCWHPAGCQMPGDGCHTPCPITPEEGRRIEEEMYGPPLGPDLVDTADDRLDLAGLYEPDCS